MEMRGVYYIWLLLPLWYGALTLWVFLRPYFKVSGKEKVATYSGSFVYTLICLFIAIALDIAGVMNPVESFLEGTSFFAGKVHIDILRILLYPVVLLVGAKLQQYIKGEEQQKKSTLPKSRWR